MIPTPRLIVLVGLGLVPVAAAMVEPVWLVAMGAWNAVVATALGLALWRRLPRRAVSVRRSVEPFQVVRRSAEVTLTVRNRTDRTLRVRVRDVVAPAMAAAPAPVPLTLAPGEERAVRYTLELERRGVHAFGEIYVRARDRLGLLESQERIAQPGELRVYPAPLSSGGGALGLQRRAPLGPGAARSRVMAEGTSFEGLRAWVPGDDPRLVDWKATARRGGRTIVREMRPERNQRLVLMIDLGRALNAGLDRGTKLDFAIEAAHELALLGLQAGDEVGLIGFGRSLRSVVHPAKGLPQARRVLDALVELQPEPVEPDYAEAFAVLGRIARRRALVVLFTDVLDRVSSQAVLRQMGALLPRHLPLCVAVEDSALAAAARAPSVDAHGVFRKEAARALVDDQARALAELRFKGVLTVHVPAEELAARTVQSYLAAKYRGRL